MDVLAVAGKYAGLDKIDDAIGTHLAVHAEVFMIAEAAEDRVGDSADAGLEDRAVGDQRRYVGGNAALDLGGGLPGELEERAVGFDDRVYFADVDEALAVGAGHLPVDLDDEVAGAKAGGEAAIDGSPQAEEAVFVGRTGLEEGDVDGELAGAEQVLDFAEEDGGVVGASGGHGGADVAAQEHAVVSENALVFGPGVGGVAERQHVQELDFAEFGGAEDQRVEERLGRAAALVDIDPVTGAHGLDGLFGGPSFGSEVVAPAHVRAPFFVAPLLRGSNNTIDNSRAKFKYFRSLYLNNIDRPMEVQAALGRSKGSEFGLQGTDSMVVRSFLGSFRNLCF